MNASIEKTEPAGGKALDIVKWLAVGVLIAVAVVGNHYFSAQPLLYRVVAGIVLFAAAGGIALTTNRGRDFNAFRQEAMVELRKIFWPTRQETLQTTFIVFVVVFIMALILWALDLLLGLVVSSIIG